MSPRTPRALTACAIAEIAAHHHHFSRRPHRGRACANGRSIATPKGDATADAIAAAGDAAPEMVPLLRRIRACVHSLANLVRFGFTGASNGRRRLQ